MKIDRGKVEYPSILKKNYKKWGKDYQSKKRG